MKDWLANCMGTGSEPRLPIALNILFLHGSRHESTPWRDGSTRYRCYHLAEALRSKGHIADIASLAEIRIEYLDRYHLVCVQRPHPGKLLDQILNRCRRLEIPTVADVDDLVFVPEYAAQSPSVVNKQANEFSVRSRFKRNLQAMLCFDEVSVATEPLAHHWREQTGKNRVTVLPNGLSKRWLETPILRTAGTDRGMRTITYLPGSNSHNRDFAEIVDIVAEILHKHADTRLLIVGTLNTDVNKFPASRLLCSQWVDYHKLPQIIADSIVTLAPLLPSAFTHAKSHIKFIESAAFGTPSICSPNHDICRHTLAGLHIAKSSQDWRNALDQVVENPHGTAELQRLQTYVRTIATASRSADVLLSHWRKDASHPRRHALAR